MVNLEYNSGSSDFIFSTIEGTSVKGLKGTFESLSTEGVVYMLVKMGSGLAVVIFINKGTLMDVH